MGREEAPPPAVRAVFDENQQIMDLIEELAAEKQHNNKAQLQHILDKIYRNIARYGDVFPKYGQHKEAYFYDYEVDTTDDDDMLKTDENLAELYELCTEADDVLLGALRKLWICSGQTESFDWVFTEHRILNLEPIRRLEGKDNPIKGVLCHTIGLLNDRGDSIDEIDDWINVFRRSLQFCLDAQQIVQGNLGHQRQELLNTILLRHRIPREIYKEIASYLTDREPSPYLRKLDIGAAYTPFPTVGKRCLECEHLDETSAIKRTCPQTALHIWNLALRRFHSFHKNAFNQWSLCSHGSDCKGYHDGSDHSWAVLRDPDFTLFIEKEAARGNDEFISLDQVGFGPVQHICLNKAEDEIRYKQLHDRSVTSSETHRDWMVAGGLGGLVDTMLHGRVLVEAWSEGEDPQEAGKTMTMTTAKWAVGRNMLVQRAAELAIMDLHSWPGRCEWCPGKELFDGEVAPTSYFQETIRSKNIEPKGRKKT
ncbi:hypothetical protein FBULB1_7536 [Fusarium bulbicola]|nr:hypothetical protein FBULB1_7536 [Fusarium bulbicola]